MNLTSAEIAKITAGKLEGPDNILITGAAGLMEAGAEDVSFCGNPKYINKVSLSKAGLLLVTDDLKTGRPNIKVANPQLAFAKILTILAEDRVKKYEPFVHSSAAVSSKAIVPASAYIGPNVTIDDGAIIGENTKIIANSYIGLNVTIGNDCIIYPNVSIRENCIIGSRVILNCGAVIGADGFGFVFDGASALFKIPQLGNVEIGDDVEVGANTTIDRATTGKTIIGKGTKIDNLVQIAHNVKIGENCIIVAQSAIAGSAQLGNWVTMAGKAGVSGHVNIADGVVIAACSSVIGDVKHKEIMSGFPARPHKQTMKSYALIGKLPEIYEKVKKLSAGSKAKNRGK